MTRRAVARAVAIELGVIAAAFVPTAAPGSGIKQTAQASAVPFSRDFLADLRKDLGAEVEAGRIKLAANSGAGVIEHLAHWLAFRAFTDTTLAANSRVYHRDSLGRFAADGGPLGEQDNLARGHKALDRAVQTQRTVRKAMFVHRLGQVDFVWGRPGHKAANDQRVTHTDGYGISHIRAKHPDELHGLVETLAKGRVLPHPVNPQKRLVVHEDSVASVRQTNARTSFAVTHFSSGPAYIQSLKKESRTAAKQSGSDRRQVGQ